MSITCKICEHIKDNGIRCGSPAMRGRHFCYYHSRNLAGRQISATHSRRVIPDIKSAYGIRVIATGIVRDLRDGRIDHATARCMAYALQVANSTLKTPVSLNDFQARVRDQNLAPDPLFSGT